MSGGCAYVLDLPAARVNLEMVDLDPLDADDEDLVRSMITRHVEETDSVVGAALLADWTAAVKRFTKVMPQDYKRVLKVREEALARGEDPVVAVMGGNHG